MKLSTAKIERIKTPGRYHDGRGLILTVKPGGGKSWSLRYQRDKRERWLGLGSARDQDIEDVRDKAQAARRLLAAGRDPLEEKRAAVASKVAPTVRITFEEAAAKYTAAVVDFWPGKKQRGQFKASLRDHAHPTLGKIAVADIKTEHVVTALEKIWTTKPKTAARVRNRIEKVLSWSTTAGFRKGENVARWSGHLETVLPNDSKIAVVKNFAALAYSELPDFRGELRAVDGIPERALEFLILTSARSGEVLNAQWTDIDLTNAVWTVPADKMKMRREHRVPLSSRAVEILRGMIRVEANPHVFPGRAGALGKMALPKVLASLRTGITVHGFRSSFKTLGR